MIGGSRDQSMRTHGTVPVGPDVLLLRRKEIYTIAWILPCRGPYSRSIMSKAMRSRGSTRTGNATERLAAAVRARRKVLRLTQAELAGLAGVGLAFLYELESGKATVRIDKVLAVFEVLGLEMHVRPGKERVSVANALASREV